MLSSQSCETLHVSALACLCCGNRFIVDPPLAIESEERLDEDGEPYFIVQEKTFDFHATRGTLDLAIKAIAEDLCFSYEEFVVKDCLLSEGAIKFQQLLKERVRCVEVS